MKAVRWPIMVLLAIVIVSIICLPMLPRIQTRYLTVAWEMWRDNSFLVPTLNGALYSHKPPLMMWMMHLGWAVFGVSETWARLIAPLFSLGTLCLVPAMARCLWPNRPDYAALVPFMLMATVIFIIYSTFVMMDSLVTFFAALGWLGMLMAWRDRSALGWILFACGIGFGTLSKGPVIMLYILPTALLAPFWIVGDRPLWGHWYRNIFLGVLGGAAIALCWVIPAIIAGGEAFANELLFKQTTNRIAGNLGHPNPWWWYLPYLPFVFFPWFWVPTIWRNAGRGILSPGGAGARFFMIASFVPLIAFFSFNGKQVHYLMPLSVPLALIGARALGDLSVAAQQRFAAILNGILMGIALIAIVYGVAVQGDWPALSSAMSWIGDLPPYVQEITITGGSLMLAFSVWAVFWAPRNTGEVARKVTVMMGILSMSAFFEAGLSVAPYMNVKPAAKAMRALEAEGHPLAFAQPYYGEFHFSGRLEKDFEIVVNPARQVAWAKAHPGGYMISFYRGELSDLPARPAYSRIYKKDHVLIWPAATVINTDAAVLRHRTANSSGRSTQ